MNKFRIYKMLLFNTGDQVHNGTAGRVVFLFL